MKLSEIEIIEQDDWSTSGVSFNNGMIKILGWSGRAASHNKNYICVCSKCAEDPELFGDGVFLSTKTKLLNGSLPCGCSQTPKWNLDQWLILVNRECTKSGFKLKEFSEFRGGATRGIFICPVHGELESKTFVDFVRGGRRCIECRRDNATKSHVIPDQEHIKQFLGTGVFNPKTKFVRSGRITPHKRYRNGLKIHWFVTCGGCKETHESLHGSLKKGQVPCSCGNYNQTIGYIHQVSDNGTPVFLKFGITNSSSSKRQSKINGGTCFDVTNIGKWKFATCFECKRAEKIVKDTLECGVISKVNFRDGWTETTSIRNLDSIIEIFESYGGIRMEIE